MALAVAEIHAHTRVLCFRCQAHDISSYLHAYTLAAFRIVRVSVLSLARLGGGHMLSLTGGSAR